MATLRQRIFGLPRPAYDPATLAGIGASLRIAIAPEGDDEGEARMRQLVERMRTIEDRPIAGETPPEQQPPAN